MADLCTQVAAAVLGQGQKPGQHKRGPITEREFRSIIFSHMPDLSTEAAVVVFGQGQNKGLIRLSQMSC